MKVFDLTKKLPALLTALVLLMSCAVFAVAEDSDVPVAAESETSSDTEMTESEEDSDTVPDESEEEYSEEASDEPSEEASAPEPSVFVTVNNARPGNYSVSGYISEEPTANGYIYEFAGRSAKITLTYIPKDKDYLWGVYVGNMFYESYDGKTVTLTAHGDCEVRFSVVGYESVNGTVVFDGSDVTGAYLTVNGERYDKGAYLKGFPVDVAAELPKGYKAETATVTFKSDREPLIMQFEDNKCVFPAIDEDFVIVVTVSGDRVFDVATSFDGEGSVSAESNEVKRGDMAVFTVTPSDGYYIEYATINGRRVVVNDGKYTATVSSDIEFYVCFAPKPTAQTVKLSVDARASGGDIGFADLDGLTAEIPYGNTFKVVFTPNEGYVLDRVYINGLSTTLSENSITLIADREYEIIAAYKKDTYVIAVSVNKNYGGTIEAVGYNIQNGIVRVDHGGSITFRFKPDMGHVIASVMVDNTSLGELENEYTFRNVTANHTLSVNFIAEGADAKIYTISVNCGPHGSAEPGNRLDVDDGSDIVIVFVPDDGYMIDTVYFDGQPATLTQGKLVLIGITADHIIQATFKERPAEEHAWISGSDIDWNSDEVTIDLTSNSLVGKDVFEKMASYGVTKKFIFSNGLFDVTLKLGSVIETDESFTDLSYDTVIDVGEADAFLGCLAENKIGGLYTVLKISSLYPSGSAVTVRLGRDFSAKTVNCYSFDGSAFHKIKIGVVADINGTVTIPVADYSTLVICIDDTAPENHIVTVNCGPNGTADPINSKPVADGGDLTIRIFPFDGYMVESVSVDGVTLELDEAARMNGACELPLTNVKKDTTVEIYFSVMPTETDSGMGLIFIVVIISVALVGGGVLFLIQWKRTKY